MPVCGEGDPIVYLMQQPLDPAQVWAVAVAIMVWIAAGLGGVVGGPAGA